MEHDEILAAVESGNRAFAAFKTTIDARLETLEAKQFGRPKNAGLEAGVRHGLRAGGIDRSQPEIKAFEKYMRTGQVEPKALDTTVGAEGGYAVPKAIDALIEDLMLLQSPIRRYASVQQISTSDFHKLVNLRGTASAWVGEQAARPATATPTLADVTPPMGELYSNPQITQQALDDMFFNASAWLAEQVADEFARAESLAFCTGNGTTQPQGLLTYTNVATGDATRAFGSVEYLPTGAAATLNATSPLDILQSTIFRLKPAYREAGANWFMNSNTLATLTSVKDTLGRFLVQPNLIVGGLPMLLGFGVVEAQHFPDIGANAYPIALANMKRTYLVVDRIGIRVLQDPFTAKPFIGFYTTKRTGGAIVNSEAMKLIKCAAA